MAEIKTEQRGDEILLSVSDDEGISAGDLYEILGQMFAKNPAARGTPVSLCLQGVETSTTLITAACNEGDDSVFWLSVSPETEEIIQRGFGGIGP